MKLRDLTADTKNANKGTDRGRKLIEKSLRDYGAGRSILLDRHGNIIAGNKTAEGAAAIGLDDVLVVKSDGKKLIAVQRTDLDIDSKAGRALAIADNRAGEIDLEWDPAVLHALNVDLEAFWSPQELEKLLADVRGEVTAPEAQIDQATALQKKWKTAPGQIWQIGRHRLMCGDCTSPAAVEALLLAHRPAVCVTDPPYGVNYAPEWRLAAGVNRNAGKLGKVAGDDRIDWTEAWKLVPGTVLYVWHAGWHAAAVQHSLEAAGFQIVCQVMWAKDRFALSRGDYHWQHEPCWYAVKKGANHSWNGARDQTTLWPIAAREDAGHGHGTQKPLECMARPIRNHAGDVYDPFLGSGTTMCAAESLGRICYGMEIEPKYVAVALERLSAMGLKPKLVE